MNHDPVEDLLRRLERPVAPRPEFAQSLLDQLLEELEGPRIPRLRPAPAWARRFLLAAAVLAVCGLVFGLLLVPLLRHGGPVLPSNGAQREVKVSATIPVGRRPGPVAAGDGAVWVGNLGDNSVSRIDPATNKVIATIPHVDAPSGIALAEGSVWVISEGDGTLTRIDAASDRVLARIRIRNGPIGTGRLAVAEGRVWVTTFAPGAVYEVDVKTNKVVATIRMPKACPQGIAIVEGRLWVTSTCTGSLIGIDPRTRRVVTTVHVGQGPLGVTTATGAIWVTHMNQKGMTDAGPSMVTRVDPTTGAITQIRVEHSSLTDIAIADGLIWVANQGGDTVLRIDPRTNRLFGLPVQVGKGPDGISVGEGAVWVTNNHGGTVSRIPL